MLKSYEAIYKNGEKLTLKSTRDCKNGFKPVVENRKVALYYPLFKAKQSLNVYWKIEGNDVD
ncbi:MAG: hypothetical protein DRR16_00370 [Candidatus Parabeggiatoa sp. nov. 3]|nr:MAG: hypothetical protein DRR00_01505 [Gammaproteobacteria bacterium]RKZ66242.1 MAG: hypothetical protein DRQ99_10265 [Gammaproteobacteria bacterium]RKZ90155.1 MAG: hypothetical protein DRR16_00370 [Gammaproteobacteria bacterium]